jgi:hypothetical protein
MGAVLRKFALLTSVCAVLLFASFASAQQQVDIMVGGSTLLPTARAGDLASFQPPQEKNGTYVSLGVDVVRPWHRLGLNIESSFRYRQADYYGNETYRPIFTDANLLFQPKLSKKVGLDFMGGFGIASNRFNLIASCNTAGCINYTSSTHFLEHLGAGVRYRIWRSFFVRPEIHYYHVENNLGFNSNNVLRAGASVGYSFGH